MAMEAVRCDDVSYSGLRIVMRTGIALLMAALVTSAWAQNVNEKLPWLGGAGATLCDKWLEVREKKASVLAFGLEGWILGYVSGAVHGSFPNEETYILSNYTESDVFGRIDSYCREHRSDMLVQAALVIVADMLESSASRIRKELNKR
jgi:hypothetical protein